MSRYTVCSYETTQKQSLIDWSKYFDAIYCIHFLPNRARYASISQELSRVEIKDSPVFKFKFTYPNVYDTLAMPKMLGQFRNPTAVNLCLAFYNLFLESLWLGHEHILILEDDIRFIPELEKLKVILDHMPEDYDYIHYDKLLSKSNAARRDTITPGDYYDSNYTGGYWGTGMTAFSRKAMEMSVAYLSQAMVPTDWLLENRDDNRLNELKRYVSHDIVVQQGGRDDEYKEGKF